MSFAASLTAAREAETDEGCRPWPKVDKNGYPTCVRVDGKTVPAHIAVYVREKGPVPPGLTLDHTCHSSSLCPGGVICPHRRCVQILHLEPITPSEQQRRRLSYKGESCGNEHLRTEENTLWVLNGRTGTWYRQCRDCNAERYERRKLECAPGLYVAGVGYIRSGS